MVRTASRRVARHLEQRLLSVVAAATAVILVVLFYYPVAT
ncbi:thiamine ABC transporter permease, partial [Haloferax elongans ATCC BAA-1513]